MLLTQEEEKHYENYFSLFMTAGWKQFVEEAEEALKLHSIETISDESSLRLIQGERSVLNRIVSFETTVRNAYDEITSND
jgi:hypothetical protein